MKKFLLTLVLIFTFSFAYSSSYKIVVNSADSMVKESSLVKLKGNVELSFKSEGEEEGFLRAEEIIVDTDNKILEAKTNVSFDQGSESFKGNVISLNWESLDIVMGDGTSSSERNNSDGDNVTFYATGSRVSFSSDTNNIFFDDGRISTTEDDPYWSIKAKKIALLGSDLLVENAVLKIGRVPVLYLPVFYYPSTTFVFNPAVGFDSERGTFLNTTTELYGVYPYFSNGNTESKFQSLFVSEDASEKIKDGIIYKTMEEGEEISDTETWARKTKSYFVFFADVYQTKGFALGFDTFNKLFDGKLEIDSTGIASVNKYPDSLGFDKDFRYAFDFNASYSSGKTNLKLSLPLYSDPNERITYLNRNSIFSFDSLFTKRQEFPSTYTTADTYKTSSLKASTDFTVLNQNIKLQSLEMEKVYKWDSKTEDYELYSSVLPSFSYSISGNILNFSKEGEKKIVENKFTDRYEESLFNELNDFQNIELSSDYKSGKEVSSTKEVTASGSSLKLSYNFKHNYENDYKTSDDTELKQSTISSYITLDSKLPSNSFSFTETITPNYVYKNNKGEESKNFVLSSNFSASVPVAGLSYNLNTDLYKLEENQSEKTESKFEWEKAFVKSHNVSLTGKLSDFTLSVKETLPPLDLFISPSVSYSSNGYSAYADVDLDLENGIFEKGYSNFRASVSKSPFNFSLSTKYNFEEPQWDGFTLNQSSSAKFFENKLALSQSMSMLNKFELQKLKISASFMSNSASISFKEKEVKLDEFNLKINLKHNPVYLWKNRIGFEGSFDTAINYDFENPYSSSLTFDFVMNFAISEFLDLALDVKSSNTSFYRYYNDEKFDFDTFFTELGNSVNIFDKDKRNSTGFNISSFSLKLVHKMSDWNLYIDASSSLVKNSKNKYEMNPKVSVYISWVAIPEIKIENNWDETDGWEK